MSIAIIDAREWQNVLDLRTGKKIDAEGPALEIMKKTLAAHHYPGDTDAGANPWVTDVALSLIADYDPRFVFLAYAQQYFSRRYIAMTDQEKQAMIHAVFHEIRRFRTQSGFEPVIVGTGGMVPFVDFIDVSRFDGLVLSTHWSARYAGLYEPSRKDFEYLESHPAVDRIITKKEWMELFDGQNDAESRLPEYLILAKEGYTFKTGGSALRKLFMIPGAAYRIPVATTLGNIESITDIRDLIDTNLKDKKIALIVVEGIGVEDFPMPHTACSNGKGWFYYEPGEAQYLTITSGKHRVFDYPTGYKYYDEDQESKEYPFSGYFTSIPEGTIGTGFSGKSIAVGNKSMFMHLVAGVDLSVECFARNLYNQGAMGVIHRPEKI